ncbi:MAG: class I SAM-dependent methyltransferase [bacterium]
MTKLVMRLKALTPAFERAVMKHWYQYAARRVQHADWVFMNFGYAEPDDAAGLQLLDREEPDRYCIQLYDHVAGVTQMAGKDVLEVGSGRGGGAAWLAQRYRPKSMIGLDFSGNAVELCGRIHCAPGLQFTHGNAEAMPFADGSFDVVINIESSHGYGRMDRFLSEVVRVLRPGGLFSWVDFRWQKDVPHTEQLFAAAGLRPVRSLNITANVLRSLDAMRSQRLALIRQHSPWFARGLFREFAAVKGSDSYDALADGRMVYLSRVFQRGSETLSHS